MKSIPLKVIPPTKKILSTPKKDIDDGTPYPNGWVTPLSGYIGPCKNTLLPRHDSSAGMKNVLSLTSGKLWFQRKTFLTSGKICITKLLCRWPLHLVYAWREKGSTFSIECLQKEQNVWLYVKIKIGSHRLCYYYWFCSVMSERPFLSLEVLCFHKVTKSMHIFQLKIN